jgi:hypothetical protein
MIETKTLLIVVAGASVPYGYPTGLQLRDELCQQRYLSALINEYYKVSDQELARFCDSFSKSNLFSIDAFLAKRGDDKITHGIMSYGKYGDVGKLAIACRLIDREVKGKGLPQTGEDHWLQYLWNHMADVSKNQFQDNQLKIISFNYDRVIECFFYTAIANTYGVDSDEADELLKFIEIVHIYGDLQNLRDRPYGVKPQDLSAVANCIKVIPEAREANDKQFTQAKEMIRWADKICFIGFGFDSINVRRLGFPGYGLISKNKIYSTQFGMTVNEVRASHKLVGEPFSCNINIELTKLKTLDYLRHEGVFLSL